MQGTTPRQKLMRLLAAALCMLLAACGITPSRQNPVAEVSEATQLEQAGKYAEAAALDEKLAATAQPAQRTEFLVSAAEDWQRAGNGVRSSALLKEINEKSLYPALQARVEILKASLYLAQHEPQTALQEFKFPMALLTPELRAHALLVRGQVHLALSDLPAAVEDWSERETDLVPGSSDVPANRELIWDTLTETHTPLDVNKLPKSTSPVARGWLELASIERTSWQQPDKFLEQIKQWQSHYPDHPAEQQLVPSLIAKQEALSSFPPRIAILLPLSGNYQAPADAVRDGLMAAYYQVGGSNSPNLTLYDSGTTAASAQVAYIARRGRSGAPSAPPRS